MGGLMLYEAITAAFGVIGVIMTIGIVYKIAFEAGRAQGHSDARRWADR